MQCHSHPYDPIAHDEFYKFTAFFNSTADYDQDDDFPKMKVAADPAKSAEASALEMNLRVLREQLNAAGHDLAKSTVDWKPFTPDVFAPSHGKLMLSDDGTIRSEGTLPKGNVHKISGPALAFSAFRLRILPEKDDPKKWPERGSLVTKFQMNLIDAAGAVTPVTMKEVFADHLGDPTEPEPGGNVGGFPKLDGPRGFVFVPEKAVSPGPGARLEISMTQKGETAGSQATPVRRFAVAGVPSLLANNTAKDGISRLDMARWIASPQNPLTARIMVNRLWGELFGTGLVQTAEDFGTSGTPPSHPELLDHLALKFENDLKWSVKSMLREIVLSSTYRQTHRATKALVEKDPANRLLARGPRNRLSAEMVRDQALAVAGLLAPKMHGPPVFPPQPKGVWSSVYNGAKWTESEGEDRFRRGIYTYSKRTSGFPGFLTFDAPSRDLCSARRMVSNTPLQALVTLNDPAHIEAAQGFAKRMSAHSAELPAQLAFGVLLATQQTASPAMIDELVSLHASCAADYQKNPAESSKLADSSNPAALVLVANTILNLDSALTR